MFKVALLGQKQIRDDRYITTWSPMADELVVAMARVRFSGSNKLKKGHKRRVHNWQIIWVPKGLRKAAPISPYLWSSQDL